MGELTTEAAELLRYLLPGFLAAWIFYGITSHPKPSNFERIVQALIFTFIVQALVPPAKWATLGIGRLVSLGPWTSDAELVSTLVLAVLVGSVVASCTNSDRVHSWLRKIGITSRTSHPSEWFCVFAQKPTYIVLQLKDGRRLYGWPKEWPVDPKRGQFYIQIPQWISENGEVFSLPELDGILINAVDVDWVEFLNQPEDHQDDKRTEGIKPAAPSA